MGALEGITRTWVLIDFPRTVGRVADAVVGVPGRTSQA